MARKKRGKGQQARPVPEETRIWICETLQRFRLSNDEVYTFNEELNGHERAAVHKECSKMGMKSKSSGRGAQRHVSVYKKEIKKHKNKKKAIETLSFLALSQQSKEVLQELFATFPPDDATKMDGAIVNSVDKCDARKRSKDDIFQKSSMNKAEIAKKVQSLSMKLEKTANLRKVTEQRSKLPIASFKDIILSTVESHQVVLVSGETGCGKTTQVPQFLLDSMWAKEKACKIVCTQPRRISATSVAKRICYERGQKVGDDIGYKEKRLYGRSCGFVKVAPILLDGLETLNKCGSVYVGLGDDVFFFEDIRLESKGGKNSSIVFCTNGVLLRVLITGGSNGLKKENFAKNTKNVVSGITHIIVDEIHERDRYSDFMLAILRDILPLYPEMRLILMSATIDVERFSAYFGGCPVIHVPGFTHPVKAFYLEDVLSILKPEPENRLDSTSSSGLNEDIVLMEDQQVALDDAIDFAWRHNDFNSLLNFIFSEGNPKVYNHQHSLNGMTPLMVFAGKGRTDDVRKLLSFGADCHLKSKDGATALEWAEHECHKETAELIRKHSENVHMNSLEEKQLLDKYIATVKAEVVDVALIEKLLMKICVDSEDAAVLIFLPGWDDINKTQERLLASPFFNDPSKFMIIALHSMIPSAYQNKVFSQPPPGCRKIILSTNIAETSITIDDVVYVIDSGRMKEKSYDPYNNVSTLQSSWVSKASAKQREGRAGRCQPGICYHLYSKVQAGSLPDFQEPEIKRVPIEEICLQAKMLDPDGKIEDFLLRTMDPPVPETIRNGILLLQDIGALSRDEKLTPLGEKLGALPVHPSTSKMLFFAILMNCLDPALTLACASDCRNPFTLPMLPDEKKKAAAAKAELASLYNGQGDHLAVIAAFECWKKAKKRGQESRFCSQYFVSSSTMDALFGMRKQLERELLRNGFIHECASSYSVNARNPGIVHAVLVAGLYPMVGKGSKRSVVTAKGERVHLRSPSTRPALFKAGNELLVVYDEIIRGMGMAYIRNCTIVGQLPVLLLATEIAVASASEDDNGGNVNENGKNDGDEIEMNKNMSAGRNDKRVMASPDSTVTVIADGWLYFGSTSLDIARIYCLREQLLKAMLFKVTNPSESLPPVIQAYVYATARILSYDGLTGMPDLSLVDGSENNKAENANAILGLKDEENQSKSFKWIRKLMKDRKSEISGHGNTISSFKGKQDGCGLSGDSIQQPFTSSSSNPGHGLASDGPPKQRKRQRPVPSVSSVPQQRPPSQGPSAGNRKRPSKQSNGQPIQSSSSAPDQKPLHEAPSLVGYGSGFFGPYGPRGEPIKRPRVDVSA